MPRGGKRKGAGRPKGSKSKITKEPSKVMRVPVGLIGSINDLIIKWKRNGRDS